MKKKVVVSEPFYDKQIDYADDRFLVYSFSNGNYIEVEDLEQGHFISLSKDEMNNLREIFNDIDKESNK